MNVRLRKVVSVALVAAALGFGAVASAGIIEKAAEKLHGQHSDQKDSGKSDAKPPKSSGRSSSGGDRPATPPARDDRSSGNAERSRGSSGGSSGSSANSRSGSDSARGDSSNSRGSSGGSGSRGGSSSSGGTFGGLAGAPDDSGRGSRPGERDRGSGHNLNDDLDRLQGRDPDRDRRSDRDRDDHRDGGWRYDDHHRRPPRVVDRLPYGYRDYYWNGDRYYFHGGSWYRPYGSSYITIGIPYGLFVTTLPGPYSSFWYGGTRYFYYDSTYYVYEPVRRGYVVTRSPYDDGYEDDVRLGDDLYIYPAQGQSEQQQADDRYDCHRWAVDQTDYDPLDDDYDPDLRADYLRAMTACLTGRGYTVN